MKSKIKVENLKKSYYIANREYEVLKNLNIEFNSGEMIAIYGESGSGKSTLMNVIGGLDTFGSGDIKFNGESISKFTNKSMDYYRNKKIGFVFQEFNLLENLSLIDNVVLPMDISGISTKESKKRAKELLIKVGLESQIKKKVNQLSGGQKQRVAIARALANDPDIILADEPTGALDSSTQDSILNLLKSIVAEGKCVAIITHSEDVANYATRVVNLVDGKIIEDYSTPEEVYSVDNDTKYRSLSLKKTVKIAFKNLLSRKFRTILVALAISLSVTGSLLITSLSSTMISGFANEVAAYESDPTITNAFVFSEQSVSANEIDKIVAEYQSDNPLISNVNTGMKISDDTDSEFSNGFESDASFSIDIDYSDEEYVSLKYGRYPENEGEIYFDGSAYLNAHPPGLEDLTMEIFSEDNSRLVDTQNKNSTYEYMVDKIQNELIGSTIILETDKGPQEFTIVGSKELNLVNIDAAIGISAFRLPYSINQEYLENLEDSENYFPGGNLYLEFESRDDLKEFISEKSLFMPDTIRGYTIIIIDLGMFTDMFITVLTTVERVFLVLTAVSLVVAIFMVAMIVYISTLERKIEIGTLRAIGAKRKNIRSIFICEGVLIGAFGFILSYIGANFWLMVINAILISLAFLTEETMITLNYMWALGLLAAVLITMFLASLYPAIKASKQNPIDALREE